MNECNEFDEAEYTDAQTLYENAVLQGHTKALDDMLRYIDEN